MTITQDKYPRQSIIVTVRRSLRSVAVTSLAVLMSLPTAAWADTQLEEQATADMVSYLYALGADSIQSQMRRKGRTDDELAAALRESIHELANCIVKVVSIQAARQDLPARPVLRMMTGRYSGPEDVEHVDEIDVIQSFDFDAIEAPKSACSERFMRRVDIEVRAAD